MADDVTTREINLRLTGVDQKLAADLEAIGSKIALDDFLRLESSIRDIRRIEDLEEPYGDRVHLPETVRLGNMLLRRPTIAVVMLLRRAIDWDRPEAWLDVYTAYCLVNARDEDALAKVATLEQADDAVAEFATRCAFESDELDQAAQWLRYGIPPHELERPDDDPAANVKKNHQPPGAGSCASSPGRRAERRATGSTKSTHATRSPSTATLSGAESAKRRTSKIK